MRTRKLYTRWGGLLLAVLMVVTGAATAGERSTGQVIDDALITTKVKASFAADPQVSALAIDVDTANGVVRLTGVVNSEAARQRALQLTQGVEGVKRVEAQNLRTQYAGAGTPQEGEHAVRGTVTTIDQRTGILSLRTSMGELTLHFPPPSVTGLKEGETITVHLSFEKG